MRIIPQQDQEHPATTPQDSGAIQNGVNGRHSVPATGNMTAAEAGVSPQDSQIKPRERNLGINMTAEQAGVSPLDSGNIVNGVRGTIDPRRPGEVVEATTSAPLPQVQEDSNLSADSAARGGTDQPSPTSPE